LGYKHLRSKPLVFRNHVQAIEQASLPAPLLIRPLRIGGEIALLGVVISSCTAAEEYPEDIRCVDLPDVPVLARNLIGDRFAGDQSGQGTAPLANARAVIAHYKWHGNLLTPIDCHAESADGNPSRNETARNNCRRNAQRIDVSTLVGDVGNVGVYQ
jgi:hypothetical protein